MKRLAFSLSAAIAVAAPVHAENIDLLIIGNSDPSFLQRLVGDGDFETVRSAFERRGADVSLTKAADAPEMRIAFREFAEGLDAATDTVGVVLTGRFVSTVAGGYLLPADMTGSLSLGQVLTDGFPLDAVYAVAAEYPGRALLVLGQLDIEGDLPDGLSVALPVQGLPQGVTAAIGPAGDVARLTDQLSEMTGDDVLPLARQAGLSLHGFVPRQLPLFIGADVASSPMEPDTESEDRAAADAVSWQEAVSEDSEAGYETYLAAFPEGQYAAEARQRLSSIRSEPFYREKQAEADLDLPRDARRDIQRDLSLLGYDTRGVDGIFGQGSRSAVAAWQDENDLTASGYLNADQIARLDAQAERRAEELEKEDRQRREEQERQDRTFWSETGAQGDEPGYRAYLNRFPDGLYAEEAQERLDAIEEQRRAEAEDQDRRSWQAARESDTEQAYRNYLEDHPNGAFVEDARARLDDLDRNSEENAVQQRARSEEAALGLNPVARRLAEARLADLGLNPGAVDGTFDKDTRRAIRRYQDARQLPVSGYLDRATAVRLMADTFLR